MDYLVFRLYGPLASWGQAAVGGDRPTGVYPTRSALIGLLAAALGIKRDEEQALEQLNQSVSIAIKQMVPSSLMRDFHTAQVPSTSRKVRHLTRKSELAEDKLNTILSSRDYRCDGLWIVAINLLPQATYQLEALKQALLTPKFTLYLGRKSCPLAMPLSPQIVNKNLKEALDTPFEPLTKSPKQDNFLLSGNNNVIYYWEGSKDALQSQGAVITTQPWDSPLNKTRWQFTQRTVHQLSLQEEV